MTTFSELRRPQSRFHRDYSPESLFLESYRLVGERLVPSSDLNSLDEVEEIGDEFWTEGDGGV